MSKQIASYNIVVIDDNEVVLSHARSLLGRSLGRNVRTFLDPALALEACAEMPPDLVLTDFNMPGMNGIELIRRARSEHPESQTLYVLATGSARRDLDAQAAEVGAAEVIRLPATPRTLVERVEAHLARLNGRVEWLDRHLPGRRTDSWPTRVSSHDLDSLRCLDRLAAFRDEDTGLHTVRMAHYAAVIAQAYGLDRDTQDLILLAAPLHDLGKIGIPESILFKPGALNDEEWAVMKQHPVVGYEILRDLPGAVFAMGADISLCHHERWDGTGYPRAISGRAIPISARIVAVADVFDALTSTRRYKPAWSLDAVLSHFANESGKHFDPDVVMALERSLESLLRVKVHFDSGTSERNVLPS